MPTVSNPRNYPSVASGEADLPRAINAVRDAISVDVQAVDAARAAAPIIGQTLTPNGGTDFLTSIAFLANTTALFWNGVALTRGVDYTEIAPRTLRFLGDFPQAGDSLTANYTQGNPP